ncbi:MAG: hypothetical protein KAG43_10230, partial [Candidatus Marithrix sp.]|nr:hypothetical protein [Candidatus Marithrix sp.]
ELKLKHPNYSGKIETSRKQWEVLQNKLQHSLHEIRNVVESTYVTYELDRIQGGNQFNRLSGELLSSANSVLDAAGITKNAIEQALNEVDEQPLLSESAVEIISDPAVNKAVEEVVLEHQDIDSSTEQLISEKHELPEPLLDISQSHSICDAQASLADIHLNMMMMAIATDKIEHDILTAEIDKASVKFEQSLATTLKLDNKQVTTLQNTWTVFKNTNKTEIIPAVYAGNNANALEIANGVQTERLNIINEIIQIFVESDCD